MSSSWSLAVGPLVRPSVRLLMFVKKWPLEYQKVIETYLPTYLWDSSDSSDSNDSRDSSDSSDSSDCSDCSDSSNSSDSIKNLATSLQKEWVSEWVSEWIMQTLK